MGHYESIVVSLTFSSSVNYNTTRPYRWKGNKIDYDQSLNKRYIDKTGEEGEVE